MSYANMDGVPTQTAGTSELLASDWNTYVRDNFDSIKFGHIVCTSSTRPTGIGEGTMIYETDTNKVLVYSGSSWIEINDLDSVGGASAAVEPFLTRRIFTNEAARDAAITSPVEGQEAYLTASTVASASGDTYAATPTGITTIYNGSAWVCTTPVGATTNTAGTTTSASYTTTLSGGGTNPSVTLSTGTSAHVEISAGAACSAIATIYVSFGVSGATTVSATDELGTFQAQEELNFLNGLSRSVTITGLTAGTNTFTLHYRGATTTTFRNRSITVRGIA